MNCCVVVNWYSKRISCLLYEKYLLCYWSANWIIKHVNSACATGVNSRKMVIIEFQRFYYLGTDTDRFLKHTWGTHWWIKYTSQNPEFIYTKYLGVIVFLKPNVFKYAWFQIYCSKGVSLYKPIVVFVVIHEICKNYFFKFHESQEKQHAVYNLKHL